MTVELPLIDCCRPLGAPTLSEEEAASTAALFKALADPARVRIVNLLASQGGFGVFFSNGLVSTIMTLGLIALFWPLIQAGWSRMRGAAAPA